MQHKRSFFERLTGAVRLDDEVEQLESRPEVKTSINNRMNVFEESDEEAIN